MATSKKSKAAQAAELRISTISDFKSRVRGTFELPSGLVVKMKNPGGLQAFLANGTIPNSLLGIVQKTLQTGNKVDSEKEARALAEDMDSLTDMMRLLDVVLVATVIEPKIKHAPTMEDVQRHNIMNPDNLLEDPEELRDDAVLYTDEVETMDKQFVQQWVTGGTRDLEEFRRQYQSSMAAVSAGEGPEDGAKPDSGADAG